MSSESTTPMEKRILQAMKLTLVNVIKDTTVQPGMRHPLHENTIEDIRQCLALISARENELAAEEGDPKKLRPRYTDEPEGKAVVSLATPSKKD